MLRATILLPKPGGLSGVATGGPPRSVQTMTTSLSSSAQVTSSNPDTVEKAPYFAELVASSWMTRANVVERGYACCRRHPHTVREGL